MPRVSGSAPKSHADSSDGDTTIDHLSEVVTRRVLAWVGRPKGTQHWVCDGLVFFSGTAGGVLCARGRRTSRCVCFRCPASREWWISPLKKSTTGSRRIHGTLPCRVGNITHVEPHEEQNKSYLISFFSNFESIQTKIYMFKHRFKQNPRWYGP